MAGGKLREESSHFGEAVGMPARRFPGVGEPSSIPSKARFISSALSNCSKASEAEASDGLAQAFADFEEGRMTFGRGTITAS